MGNMFGRNLLRKSYTADVKETVCNKFRKSISERIAAPIKENSLERTPESDSLFLDK